MKCQDINVNCDQLCYIHFEHPCRRDIASTSLTQFNTFIGPKTAVVVDTMSNLSHLPKKWAVTQASMLTNSSNNMQNTGIEKNSTWETIR